MSFILVIIALVWIYLLSRRIDALERRAQNAPDVPADERVMNAVELAALNASRLDLMVPPVGAPPVPPVPVPTDSYRMEAGDDPVSRCVEWVKKDFMMKLGAFLLLCALGWFVSYAFAHNWIGEVGRITLGLLLGVVFLCVAVWRAQTHLHQGSVFAILGSTTVLLTTYAARELYGFFTPASALFIMELSIVLVAFLSVRHESRNLALAGLVLAALAPQFTSSPSSDVLIVFPYLTMVVLGTLWVVYLRRWHVLTFVALVVVFLHGLPYALSPVSTGDRDVALLFAFFFGAIFFAANVIGLLKEGERGARISHILVALGTGLYLLLWIMTAALPEWQSLLCVFWMLVFSLGGFIVYRVARQSTPFFIYGGTSIVLLGAATAFELDGHTLTIAYTLEVTALVLLAIALLKNVRIASQLALLFIIPVLLSLESTVASSWYSGIFHEDSIVLVIVAAMLAVTGLRLRQVAQETGENEHTVSLVLVTAAAVYGLALIWLVLHAGTYWSIDGGSLQRWSSETSAYDRATMYALILYTMIGIALSIGGSRREQRALQLGGAVLLGFVVLRLLFVEVWDMELQGRIVTFAAIGLLLIGTAFVRKKALPKHDDNSTTV